MVEIGCCEEIANHESDEEVTSSMANADELEPSEASSVANQDDRGQVEASSVANQDDRGQVAPSSVANQDDRGQVEPSSVANQDDRGQVEPSSVANQDDRGQVEPSSVANQDQPEQVEPSSVAKHDQPEQVEASSVANRDDGEQVEPASVANQDDRGQVEPSSVANQDQPEQVEPSSVANHDQPEQVEASSVANRDDGEQVEASSVTNQDEPDQVEASSVTKENTFEKDDAQRLDGATCLVCQEKPSKYCCPACQKRTCSLECVLRHKQTYGCQAQVIHTRLKSVAAFGNLDMLSDYRLLEQAARTVSTCRAQSAALNKKPMPKLKSGQKPKDTPYRRNQIADRLAKACRQRQLRWVKVSPNLEKARLNTSVYNHMCETIFWRVGWTFPDLGDQANNHVTVEQDNIPETVRMRTIIRRLLQPREGREDERLQARMDEYAEALEKGKCHCLMRVEQNGWTNDQRYFSVDLEKTLLENLFGRVVVEYPTFSIVLADSLQRYPLITEQAQKAHLLKYMWRKESEAKPLGDHNLRELIEEMLSATVIAVSPQLPTATPTQSADETGQKGISESATSNNPCVLAEKNVSLEKVPKNNPEASPPNVVENALSKKDKLNEAIRQAKQARNDAKRAKLTTNKRGGGNNSCSWNPPSDQNGASKRLRLTPPTPINPMAPPRPGNMMNTRPPIWNRGGRPPLLYPPRPMARPPPPLVYENLFPVYTEPSPNRLPPCRPRMSFQTTSNRLPVQFASNVPAPGPDSKLGLSGNSPKPIVENRESKIPSDNIVDKTPTELKAEISKTDKPANYLNLTGYDLSDSDD